MTCKSNSLSQRVVAFGRIIKAFTQKTRKLCIGWITHDSQKLSGYQS